MPQTPRVIRIIASDGKVRFAEVITLFQDEEGRVTGTNVLGPVGWVEDTTGSRLHIGGMTVPVEKIVTPLRQLMN